MPIQTLKNPVNRKLHELPERRIPESQLHKEIIQYVETLTPSQYENELVSISS